MRERALRCFCGVALLAATGCQTRDPAPRRTAANDPALRRQEALLTPHTLPPPATDEADLVLRACGQPISDKVLPIYSNLEHGPVRQLVFAGRQRVVLEFVPSDPEPHTGRKLLQPAHPLPPLTARLPPNTVWDFEEGRMEEEEFLTTTHLAVYLPCAARALAATD